MHPDTGGTSIIDFFVALAVGYIFLLLIATFAVFPPRTAWNRRALVGSLIVAVMLFVCSCIPLIPFVRRYIGGE